MTDRFADGDVALQHNRPISVIGAKICCGAHTVLITVAVKRQVSTIPILFINVDNPVGVGLVESLSRPGSNVTGFSDMHADLSGKYVQFASELGEPQATVNYLWYTEWADGQYRLQSTEQAAQSLGVKLRSRGIADIAEANDVLAAYRRAASYAERILKGEKPADLPVEPAHQVRAAD